MLNKKIAFVLFTSLSMSVVASRCEQESQGETEQKQTETRVSSESYEPILQSMKAELDRRKREQEQATEEVDEFDLFLESFDEEEIPEVTLLEKAQAAYSYVTATLQEGGFSVKKHITDNKMAYSGMLSTLLLATGIYCVLD